MFGDEYEINDLDRTGWTLSLTSPGWLNERHDVVVKV